MNRIKSKADWLFAAITFIAVFCAMRYVRYYGDDYYYLTFAKMPPQEFWGGHLTHYLEVNGRAIVHILDTFFLKLPPIVWQIANSLFLSAIVLFGTRALSRKSEDNSPLTAGCILTCAVLALGISATRQGVYWTTGSFNYVYPLALLMLFWYLLGREKTAPPALFIAAFLSGATTEQNAMMTVGLCFLYLSAELIFEKKWDKKLIACLVFCVFGAATVFFAPATFVRAGLEGAQDSRLADVITYNLKFFFVEFITSRSTLIYQALFFASSILYVFKEYRQKLVRFGLLTAAPFVFALMCVDSLNKTFIFDGKRLLIIAVILVYMLLLTGAALIKLLQNKHRLPIIALILCYGAQLMMFISPVYGQRNMIGSLIMLAFYSAGVLSLCLKKTSGAFERKALVAALALVFVASSAKMYGTISGYKQNMSVDLRNIELINEYLAAPAGNRLHQYRLISEDHGWSMPYNSNYHLGYYKLFYGIPGELEIEWLPFDGAI